MADKEYIERGALLKKIFPYGDIVDPKCYTINAKMIQKEIQDAPAADVVDVVRCKDCKHGIVMNDDTVMCRIIWDYRTNEFFCKSGERSDKT